MNLRAFLCSFVLIASAVSHDYRLASDFVPDGGYVPNATTAIKIAEAVLVPVYGEEKIGSELPLRATLKNDVWTVEGTSPCSKVSVHKRTVCYGGVAIVKVSKLDARILSMIHYK